MSDTRRANARAFIKRGNDMAQVRQERSRRARAARAAQAELAGDTLKTVEELDAIQRDLRERFYARHPHREAA